MKNSRNKWLLGAFLTIFFGAIAEAKERHIFLLIGQSNMAGRAKIESGDSKPIDGAFLWNVADKKWESAVPPYNLHSPSRKAVKMQNLNCGPSFVKAYLKKNPDVEVGVVCVARGGTSIGQWSREKPDQFDLYRHAIEAAKAALAGGGELRGILWHQGESDSGEGVGAYPKKLADLVSNLRGDLNSPMVPFVYAQLGQWKENYAEFNKMIVKQPAQIPVTACVTTEEIKHFDNIHFDSAGQRELGRRYAAAIQKLISGK